MKPVKSYEKPEYTSYRLKNGLKLTAGVAATAMLMGSLSGCALVETAGRKLADGLSGQPGETIEVIDGDIACVEYPPEEEIEMTLGEEPVVDSMRIGEMDEPESDPVQYEVLSGIMASSMDAF